MGAGTDAGTGAGTGTGTDNDAAHGTEVLILLPIIIIHRVIILCS